MRTPGTWTEWAWVGAGLLIIRNLSFGQRAIFQALRDFAVTYSDSTILAITDQNIPRFLGHLLACQPELVTSPNAGKIQVIPWETAGRRVVYQLQNKRTEPKVTASFIAIDVAGFEATCLPTSTGCPVLVAGHPKRVGTHPSGSLYTVFEAATADQPPVDTGVHTIIKVLRHPLLDQERLGYIRVTPPPDSLLSEWRPHVLPRYPAHQAQRQVPRRPLHRHRG